MREEWYQIKDLIIKHIRHELIADEEQAVLNDWLKDDNNRQMYDELMNEEKLTEKLNSYDADINYYRSAVEVYKQQVKEKLVISKQFFIYRRLTWLRYVAAASVFFMLAIGAYLWYTGKQDKDKVAQEKTIPPGDIPPGHDGAILTLDNGQQIVLDSAVNGLLTQQGNSNVVKTDGTISYATANATAEVVYNTLATQRGRKYQLSLPDGTNIWLNASSSVTFPNAFVGVQRRVQVSGEVYLEVAKDAAHPFIAAIKNPINGQITEVEVLGTAFNINSYPEEPGIRTTLIEGSVKVRMNNRSITIAPGQQAEATSTELTVHDNVDTLAVLAWKNGQIVFDNVDVKTIMRQISRWYDVDVEFKDEVAAPQISGKIPRTLTLLQVLKAISLNSQLKIELVDKKIIVSR